MRILIVNPGDDPRRGPWRNQKWDLVVDLAHGAQAFTEDWSGPYECPVVCTESLAFDVTTSRTVHNILSEGRGRLVDDEGIDWWELISLLLAEQVFAVLSFKSISSQIRPDAEVWITSRDSKTNLLEVMLERQLRSFQNGAFGRGVARANHYLHLLRAFSLTELKQIAFDKYDPGYEWRRRFASGLKPSSEPVVLVPSAYGNVSRMAAEYATLLPQQQFLLVATRDSAKQFDPPPNFALRDLSGYATSRSREAEFQGLMLRWSDWRTAITHLPELGLLLNSGAMNSVPERIRHGLETRDAWRNVLETEPVCGVFCGDDSNLYTRIPVQLASRRGIPTLDFHHGALDGRYMLKDLPSDRYLAKNDMERDYLLRVCGLPAERVVIGAPPVKQKPSRASRTGVVSSAVFFSEPYEVAGMRAEDVYRQILARLCRLARENQRSVIVKLHPFESLPQRKRMVDRILGVEDRKLVSVRGGPLTSDLLAQTWFGLTVESTTVIQCLQNGICCFLCGWFSLSPYGYGQHYVRFNIGETLHSPDLIGDIPARLQQFEPRCAETLNLSPVVDTEELKLLLTHSQTASPVRLHS